MEKMSHWKQQQDTEDLYSKTQNPELLAMPGAGRECVPGMPVIRHGGSAERCSQFGRRLGRSL